jgi:hypothetical protein
MPHPDRRKLLLEQAWIGDAVLTLFARQHILATANKLDHEQAVRMTSNKFLQAFADPSEVEARIGRIYSADGLAAAFLFIESNILPLYLKQQPPTKKQGRKVSPPPSL